MTPQGRESYNFMKNISGSFCLILAIAGVLPAQAPPGPVDRGAAYYNYAMGHLYAELATTYGNRGEYLNKAIDHFREVLKLDPRARLVCDELSDLYVQSGRLREAVLDSEAALRQNPDNLNERRILGRIYSRLIGDTQQGRLNEEMLRKAIDQYQKISEKEPGDVEIWLTLGRLHKVAQNSVEAEKAFSKALDTEPDNEDALTGLALVYADLGDSKKASLLLNRVAQKNPNLRTLTALAGIYEQLRDYKSAASTLAKALELSRDNPEIKRALAQNMMLSDKLDEAAKLYEELVADEEKDIQSHLRLSQIYRQQRKFEKARQAGERAKALAPDNIEILYNEVSILETEGKTPEAIGALKEILSLTEKRSYSAAEKNSRALLLERLGLLYRSAERFDDAIQTFRDVAALDANHAARASAQIVDTHRQAKEFQKALEEAEAAFQKYPEDRTIRVVRASLLAETGQAARAADDIRKLLDGKSDRETWLSLAQIHEKGKDYAAMAKALSEAEQLSTGDEEKEVVHFMRGAMFEKLKKYDDSENAFRKVLAINPESASALNYLGYMLADRNVRLTEAHDMIQKALAIDPHNGAYLDSLGWLYFRQGRLDLAEQSLLRSLQRVSRDPTIHDHLGDVYLRRGKLKEAIAQWESSLKEWLASSPSERDPNEVAKITRKLEGAKVRLAKESGTKP